MPNKIEATRTEAILSPKYKLGNRREWFADVQCGACSRVHTLPLNGWTAIVCTGCRAEMHKPAKKRGRPPGSGTERKGRGIRFSEEEWTLVGDRAKAEGLTRSAYLRSRI